MRHFFAFLLFACAVVPSSMYSQKIVSQGYVTAITSSSVFDFNGMHVILSPKAKFFIEHPEATPKYSTVVATLPQLYLGETIEMTGVVDRKSNEIKASELAVLPRPSPDVSGIGIIDLIPPSLDQPKDLSDGKLIRADGYLLFIPSSVKTALTQPIASIADVRTNQWISYHGKQRPDGIVLVDQATISPNTINHREDKLRVHGDYDPSVIDSGDAQSGVSKFFLGKDPTRLPAWHDAAMQTRVDHIGKSLIPAFQNALPEDDPTRIDFRFQVIDEPKLKDAWSLASGIILVPHQVVERLSEDSQLAAVLSDSIAEVLEKQELRVIPAKQKMTAASAAGAAAGIFIPGASLVPLVANHEVGKAIVSHSRQQSGRVSLCLMHDAGYNIAEAPKAWWLLAAKSTADPLPTKMPDHTLFLYEDLGTTWRTQLDQRTSPTQLP